MRKLKENDTSATGSEAVALNLCLFKPPSKGYSRVSYQKFGPASPPNSATVTSFIFLVLHNCRQHFPKQIATSPDRKTCDSLKKSTWLPWPRRHEKLRVTMASLQQTCRLIKAHWFVLCRRTQCPKTRSQGPRQGQHSEGQLDQAGRWWFSH